MKQLLVLAIALTSVNAFATRARMAALGSSPNLVDTQTVYNNPADMFSLGSDYVTLETGLADSTTGSNGAEGMVVRTMGDAKFGLSLGHDTSDASVHGLRGTAGLPAGLNFNQQNPVEFTYGTKSGDTAYAGTLVYSNYVDKTATDKKETSTAFRFGARSGNWDAALRLGLTNTVQTAADGKFTGSMGISANGGYNMGSMYYFGSVNSTGFKYENAAAVELAKVTSTSIMLGGINTIAKDGAVIVFGGAVAQSDMKESVSDSKVTSTTLPLWVGYEADAASWLTVRGSVVQTLQLLNNSKSTTGAVTNSEFAPGANDTAVNAGLGFKFNKVTVDGTLQATVAGTSQQLNGNSLLTTLGMSYWF